MELIESKTGGSSISCNILLRIRHDSQRLAARSGKPDKAIRNGSTAAEEIGRLCGMQPSEVLRR